MTHAENGTKITDPALFPESTMTSETKVQPYYSPGCAAHEYDADDRNGLERVSTRYSEQHVYGNMNESEIGLQRQKTQHSIISRAEQNSLYHDTSKIEMTGNDGMPSGMEFEKDDPELVSWEGPDDAMDPRNWTQRRKWKITLVTSLQSIIPTYASSAMAPVIPNILADFNNSNRTVGSLMDSIMVLVWGIGCMMWAPLSEVYGRRRILIVSSTFHLGFSIGCALAPNTASMIVFRGLAGVFNSVPVAVGAGIIGDIFSDKDRQWPLALWDLTPCCGPAIAPIIAAWIAQETRWFWTFWIIVALQGFSLIVIVTQFDETYPQAILSRKKKQLQKITGNKNLHTIWDLTKLPVLQQVKLATIRPFLFLILNPVVLLLSIYMAYTYGFMYLILNDFPDLWTDVYHYSPGIGGLMYIGYIIGTVLGVFTWTSLINWWYDRQEARGKGRLEDRLFWLPISTLFFAGGMFWYGWSAEAKLPWPMPVVGIGIFSFSIFCVFQSVQSYLVSLNVRLAGSILASCVLFRSILGGTFPLFGHAMYKHLGYGWASTTVAFMALALGVPWPACIYIYGPRLRRWVDDNVHIN